MRIRFHLPTPLFYSSVVLALLASLAGFPANALNGGNLQIETDNGWLAFEVITRTDKVEGDGFDYEMPGVFDGLGAWLPDSSTLRMYINHETSDASISEVDMDLAKLHAAINKVVVSGDTGGEIFVKSARQAYDRWSNDSGTSFMATSSIDTTSFRRFCSGQSYEPHTFGYNRGFVDPLYITGEEVPNGRLFVLNSVKRELYQLSGMTGSAIGGIGGMPFDSWENAALIDTGESSHIALLLSPDQGTSNMVIYIGEKGRDAQGQLSNGFLARNGLAYGSWYFLNSSLPFSAGQSNPGFFDTTVAGALNSSKLEDVDTSPAQPWRVALGDQDSGVFIFDFNLVFDNKFNAADSNFSIFKLADIETAALGNADNLDWISPVTLGGNSYPEGLVFVNEDHVTGEIWAVNPLNNEQQRIANAIPGGFTRGETSGILDISGLIGYLPGSILATSNQSIFASMTILINPDATLDPNIRLPLADKDEDGVLDTVDNCPDVANADQLDADSDAIGDVCDPFPENSNHELAQCDIELSGAIEENQRLQDSNVFLLSELDRCEQTGASLRSENEDLKSKLDTDADGIPDARDLCPNTPAWKWNVRNDGCHRSEERVRP